MKNIISSTVLAVALLFGVAWLLVEHMEDSNREEIIEKVESKNAEIISIEQNGIFKDDPFRWYERNSKTPQVYKFTYEKDGEIQTGWVSFDYFHDYWKFDNE